VVTLAAGLDAIVAVSLDAGGPAPLNSTHHGVGPAVSPHGAGSFGKWSSSKRGSHLQVMGARLGVRAAAHRRVPWRLRGNA
jgi:hypothetical protein